jgi:hypothetical protein
MHLVMTAKIDDFAITIDSRLLILSTVLTEVPLHQPGFCVLWIYLQNLVEKDLGNIPSFLRYCPSCV